MSEPTDQSCGCWWMYNEGACDRDDCPIRAAVNKDKGGRMKPNMMSERALQNIERVIEVEINEKNRRLIRRLLAHIRALDAEIERLKSSQP